MQPSLTIHSLLSIRRVNFEQNARIKLNRLTEYIRRAPVEADVSAVADYEHVQWPR